MNCSKIRTLISAYTDRELSGVEMFLIRQHVHECDACREEEAEVRRVKAVLSSIELAEPSPDFEARLVMAVMGTKVEPAEEKRLRTTTAFAVTTLAAAAAICVVYSAKTMSPHSRSGTLAKAPAPKKLLPKTGPNIAITMQRDSAFINSSDPLSGPPGAIAASYAAP